MMHTNKKISYCEAGTGGTQALAAPVFEVSSMQSAKINLT
jgi:hypothetical protein